MKGFREYSSVISDLKVKATDNIDLHFPSLAFRLHPKSSDIHPKPSDVHPKPSDTHPKLSDEITVTGTEAVSDYNCLLKS